MGQLARALNEMSDNLQETMEQMIEARTRAEKSDKAKGVFLANVSHEIRTPLNAIIGMTRLALRNTSDDSSAVSSQNSEGSADSLLSLINDILDFSKVEAGQLILDSHLFDLRDFVNSTLHAVKVQAHGKGLVFRHSIHENVPNFARGDGLRLKQILSNVLNNALKFTDQGGIETRVEILEGNEKEMRLQVTVKDTGIGIPEEMKDEIFHGFSQVDKTISREHQGAGLGLAITKKLCQLMNGDVSIDCTEGVGCTFVFTVVLERVDGVNLTPDGVLRTKTAGKKLNILVVEDNLANRDLARMILEADGHSVVEAANGFEALNKLAEDKVDLIFMDIQMPRMDGLVTTRIIRSLEKGTEPDYRLESELKEVLSRVLKGRNHLIVALTAHAMSGDREKCLTVGIDRYLTKPFFPEQILAVLDDASLQ